MSKAPFKLTVRHGPTVDREQFAELGGAIAALERRAGEVRAAGPLPERKTLRDFEPGEQVAARLEISTGAVLRRGREAGVDVMGDGSYVAFTGGLRRSELDTSRISAFEAVRAALS